MKKRFSFAYPLRHKVVRDLRIVTETVGTLEIEAVGYFDKRHSPIDVNDRYKIDLEFVRWQGTDIREVLEITGGLEEIEEASVRYFANLIEERLKAA